MAVVGVMTWNLENLFLPAELSGARAKPTTEKAYESKLDSLAATIDAAKPDVVAVQEVGDPDAAEALAKRLDGAWDVAMSEHPDGRGIRVGVLSRQRIRATEQILAFPEGLAPVQVGDDGKTIGEMGRGALHVRVSTDAGEVDIVTCHLKSKLITFPGGRFSPRNEDERARFGAYALYRRTAESTTIRAYVNGLLRRRSAAVVLCGDLNDEQEAATTQILLGPGGSEIGTRGFDTPDKGDRWRLWNTAPLIARERRYSRIYRGRRELIDHILVSHRLVKRVERVDSLVDRRLPSIEDDPGVRAGTADSDHAPVIATIG